MQIVIDNNTHTHEHTHTHTHTHTHAVGAIPGDAHDDLSISTGRCIFLIV